MKSSACLSLDVPGLDGRDRVATFPSDRRSKRKREQPEAWRPESAKANAPTVDLLTEITANAKRLQPAKGRRFTIILVVLRTFFITFSIICFSRF